MSCAPEQHSPINPDELAWAIECARAGDTLAEIAEGSGRTEAVWRDALQPTGVRCGMALDEWDLEPRDRLIAERYLDGITFANIGAEIGITGWWVCVLAERLVQRGVLQRRPPMTPNIPPETRAAIAERLRIRAREGQGQYLPERNAEILALVKTGDLNYTEIGARFGTTRPAVAGVVHRDRRRRALVARSLAGARA
ncbi:MAG TPA: hypothetical protein VFW13_01800 [Phenylobacterium sp.]|nr:hypothetical protein [Phenylobacterium sp.]